jgi:hypothetical protein
LGEQRQPDDRAHGGGGAHDAYGPVAAGGVSIEISRCRQAHPEDNCAANAGQRSAQGEHTETGGQDGDDGRDAEQNCFDLDHEPARIAVDQRRDQNRDYPGRRGGEGGKLARDRLR